MSKTRPLWHYNKPNLEHVALNYEQARRNINYPVWIPRSFPEVWAFTALMLGAHRINFKPYVNFGPLKFGIPFTGIPKVVICMGAAFAGCRTIRYMYDRYCEKSKLYLDDYLRIYPDKFDNYTPKKLIDTFDDYWVVRSGGPIVAWTVSEDRAFGAKPETDHYMPTNSDKPL